MTRLRQGTSQSLYVLSRIRGGVNFWTRQSARVWPHRNGGYYVKVYATDPTTGTRFTWPSITIFPTKEAALDWLVTSEVEAALS